MNILIDILGSIMKSLGTITIEQDSQFGLPILISRIKSNYLGPGIFDGILTRDEAEEAYEKHIEFLDMVGDETIEQINKLNREMSHPDYNADDRYADFSEKLEKLDKVFSEVRSKVSAKVYIIKSGDKYKIGFSSNPSSRINGVVSPNGERKELLFTIDNDNPRGLESFLHRVFNHKHFSGEWFILSDIDIEWIKQSVPYLEKRDFGRPFNIRIA